jgi:hypothetical protein
MALTLKQYADAKKLRLDFLRTIGARDGDWQGRSALHIPYLDRDGVEACVRIRVSLNDNGRFRWEVGAKPCLYGLWRLKRKKRVYTCVVEGESDCHTLWQHGFPAVGLPGAANWKEEWVRHFTGFERIYVVIEPDEGGEAVIKWLRTSEIRDRVRLIRLMKAKDPSKLYLKKPKGFPQAWQSAMKASTPWHEWEPATKTRRTTLSRPQRLLRLAEQATLFHTPDGVPFATVPVNEHLDNWPLGSRQFRHWLLSRYYQETKTAPHQQALHEALHVIESRAHFEGLEQFVSVRLAEMEGKIYLDLCNEKWEGLEIDSKGWQVLSSVPVKFRRARGMLPLPVPVRGGSIEQLRPFVNVAAETDWILLLAWLLAALRPRGPHPILVLHGEQGSAKSTTSRVLRALLDPSTAPLRSEPRDVRDMVIAASNGWVMNLDNLSQIPIWLSDALCRLATGGGFSTRELYTDAEEVLFDVQRPVILNGIEELAVRGDLLDRALILYLPPITEQKREAESSFWSQFETARPAILGALLDAVSSALRHLSGVRLEKTPRLADFAFWVTAAERGLGWEEGAFLRAYKRNQSAANDLALDVSPITEVVRSLVSEAPFEGTASDLLKTLTSLADESIRRQKGWPPNAQSLSNTLRRLAPNLRKSAIEVGFSRSKDRRRRRLISLREIASGSSAVSERLRL